MFFYLFSYCYFTGSSDENFARATTYLCRGIHRAKSLVNYCFSPVVFIFLPLLVVIQDVILYDIIVLYYYCFVSLLFYTIIVLYYFYCFILLLLFYTIIVLYNYYCFILLLLFYTIIIVLYHYCFILLLSYLIHFVVPQCFDRLM